MKVYKICFEDFDKCRQREFIYKDLYKAKSFVINALNEVMQNISHKNNDSTFSEDREYIFEIYEDEEIKNLNVNCKEYYKSVKRIDDYIIEIVNTFSEKLTYTYQVKYSILVEDEKYTDYNYSIDIEEFEVIE